MSTSKIMPQTQVKLYASKLFGHSVTIHFLHRHQFWTSSSLSYIREDYETLGIKPGATKSEIKKAYFEKAKTFHPDANKSNNSKEFLKISEAYNRLMGKSFDYKNMNYKQGGSDPRMRENWNRNPREQQRQQQFYYEEMKNNKYRGGGSRNAMAARAGRAIQASLPSFFSFVFLFFLLRIMMDMSQPRTHQYNPESGCRCGDCVLEEMKQNPRTSQLLKISREKTGLKHWV